MPVERAAGGSSLIDVLDRILDKGIVIDAWIRVSLVGIDLITVEARVVVVCPECHAMTTCSKAKSQSEAALLRLVQTLVQRLLGISQTPQCLSPRSQRVGTVM